jgi:hypothetical protein
VVKDGAWLRYVVIALAPELTYLLAKMVSGGADPSIGDMAILLAVGVAGAGVAWVITRNG